MIEVFKSATFDIWLNGLKDIRAAARVQVGIDRLATGNPGDVKPVGEGVFELRIDYGPGYRAYFIRRGSQVVVLLCGGDKSTQEKDIVRAKLIATQWKD